MPRVCYLKSMFLSYILLLIVVCSNAQQFKVSLSEPVNFTSENKGFKYGSYFISFKQGEVKNQMGRFKLYKEKFQVKLFVQDQSMKLVKEVALSNGERAYGPFKPSLKKINNKPYFIYFQMSAEADDVPIHVMAAEIDTLAMALFPPKEILTIDFKNTAPFYVVANTIITDKLEIAQSPDNSTTLVTWSSGNDNLYFYSVLDSNLKVQRSKNGIIKTVTAIQLTGIGIDKNENVYLGFKGIQSKELEGGHIIIGSSKSPDKDIRIPISEGQANEVNIIVSAKDGNVQVVGTYKTDSENLSGVYSTSLSTANFKLGSVQLSPFTNEILEQLKKEQWEWASTKDKNKGIFDCLDMEPYELQNGTIDIIGMFDREHLAGSSSFKILGSVFLVHFNNGKATFCAIPKFTTNTLPYVASSYSVFINKNTSIIFYNEHKDNLNNDLKNHIYRATSTNNIVFVAATVSEGKVIRTEKVVDLQNENLLGITDGITRTGANSILVPFPKVKKYGGYENLSRLVTITID